MIQQQKINSFIRSITDTAEKKKSAVVAETKEILDSERAAMETAARKAADDYTKARSAEIKRETGKRISENAAECRKAVFNKRNEIAQKTLGAVSEKLKAFTESEEYKAFLLNSAKNILEAFGSGSVTLLLSPEDMKFAALLCENFAGISVSEDSTIKIGGVKGINSTVTLLIDDTLDSRLANQKKWFEENSGLYIRWNEKNE